MAKSVRDRLLDALEDLEEEQLKRFKRKLNETPLRAGFDHIPRGRLQKADPLDLSDLLVSYYTDLYAVQVAAQVLEAVNLRREAERLLSVAGIGKGSGIRHPRAILPWREPISVGSHFIERHRAELIQRTSTVEGVLDLLHGRVLDDEQYERISSRETNPDKMRELYRLVPSWDCYCKDQLYEALKAKNKFLIRDLEGK
uniref:apoptosis-associated speck-like protein containing a CARD n=1 Tax=Euleptes europaea TaxID=460621 RepID=UPI0025421FA9|nr:apoptosis-associated speck-like protein containing a CARD [Euleptes europaea]